MIEASEIAQFRWKQRLLLIVSDDTAFINQQLELLSAEDRQGDWKERKLSWMILSTDRYLVQGANWQPQNRLFEEFQLRGVNGINLLVGLDGSIKKRYSGLVSPQEIFDLIDTMPMRQTELKNKQ